MDQPTGTRKLASILMADVVGYSRLIGEDENAIRKQADQEFSDWGMNSGNTDFVRYANLSGRKRRWPAAYRDGLPEPISGTTGGSAHGLHGKRVGTGR